MHCTDDAPRPQLFGWLMNTIFNVNTTNTVIIKIMIAKLLAQIRKEQNQLEPGCRVR